MIQRDAVHALSSLMVLSACMTHVHVVHIALENSSPLSSCVLSIT